MYTHYDEIHGNPRLDLSAGFYGCMNISFCAENAVWIFRPGYKNTSKSSFFAIISQLIVLGPSLMVQIEGNLGGYHNHDLFEKFMILSMVTK